MPYGYVEGEARKRAEEELDARNERISDEVLLCVSCTNARRKARIQDAKDWRRAECKNHRMKRQIAYNTSPLSEAYWSS